MRTPFKDTEDSLRLRLEDESLEPLAIIGISTVFPQDADSTENFWKMLLAARSALTDVPDDRYNIYAHYNHDKQRMDTVRSVSYAIFKS